MGTKATAGHKSSVVTKETAGKDNQHSSVSGRWSPPVTQRLRDRPGSARPPPRRREAPHRGVLHPQSKVGVGRAGREQVGQKPGAPRGREAGGSRGAAAQRISQEEPRAWRWEVTESGVKNAPRASP